MDIGGVQKVIIDITENLTDIKFDLIVFGEESGYYEKEFLEYGGKIFRIIDYSGNNIIRKILEPIIKKFRIFRKTNEIIRNNGPYAAIHSHNQFRGVFTNLAALFNGVKVRVTHSHNDKPPFKLSRFKRFLYSIYRVIIIKVSNVFLACSEGSAKYLFGKERNVEIVLNGTNLKRFDINKYESSYDNKYGFINVGRYNIQKNHLFLLDIFSNILKNKPEAKLILIGHGEDEQLVIDRISKIDLKGHVIMLPATSDVPYYLSKTPYMILPSLYEGFPNVQIEAQVMGVECFLSDTITRDSNLGLSTYIDLNSSPENWSNIIIKHIEKADISIKKKISDQERNRIDVLKICSRYKEIYKGKLRT